MKNIFHLSTSPHRPGDSLPRRLGFCARPATVSGTKKKPTEMRQPSLSCFRRPSVPHRAENCGSRSYEVHSSDERLTPLRFRTALTSLIPPYGEAVKSGRFQYENTREYFDLRKLWFFHPGLLTGVCRSTLALRMPGWDPGNRFRLLPGACSGGFRNDSEANFEIDSLHATSRTN